MNALIIVDLQNDFCPGGSLAVPEGNEVVPVINRLQPHFDLVVATRDSHPPNHCSFAANHPGKQVGEVTEVAGLEQYLWPVHCVQSTAGAELHPDLNRERIEKVFRKGIDPEIDSYSGFFDNGRRRSTGLADFLKERGIRDVYLGGLAADVCVKFTALDAVELGFGTHLIEDATRGVNVQPGDTEKALAELRAKGVKVVRSDDLVE